MQLTVEPAVGLTLEVDEGEVEGAGVSTYIMTGPSDVWQKLENACRSKSTKKDAVLMVRGPMSALAPISLNFGEGKHPKALRDAIADETHPGAPSDAPRAREKAANGGVKRSSTPDSFLAGGRRGSDDGSTRDSSPAAAAPPPGDRATHMETQGPLVGSQSPLSSTRTSPGCGI